MKTLGGYKLPNRVRIPARMLDDALVNIIDEYKHRITKNITLKRLADRTYSDYIRRTKSRNGICECITCKKKFKWDKTG